MIENEVFEKYDIKSLFGDLVQKNDQSKIIIECSLWNEGTGGRSFFREIDGHVVENFELDLDKIQPIALALRKDIYLNSGQRLWQVNFILDENNTFNIEYDFKARFDTKDFNFDFEKYIQTGDGDLAEEAPQIEDETTEETYIFNSELLQDLMPYRHALELKTKIASETWGLDRASSWEIDQIFGMLTFIVDGQSIFKEVEIVGTYDKAQHNFMWAWANDSIDEDWHEVADLVKHHGVQHQLDYLTYPIIECSEDEAWSLIALACDLGEAEGAYRGLIKGQDTLVYMLFRDEADED